MVDLNLDFIKHDLMREAFIYPPMEPFESPYPDARGAMSSVLARCSELSGTTTWHADMLKSWLAALRLRHDVAFYGSALNDTAHAKDIDVLYFHPDFPSQSFPPTRFRPENIHIFDISEASQWQVSGYASVFLAGALLFPDQPDTSLLRRIEAERRVMQGLPFFKGGIGEMLTYAAFKAAQSPSPEDSRLPDFPAMLKFRVELRWLDGSNMRMVTYPPHELNEQIREQMRALKDPEVHALAIAAMRRVRVKESEQPALAARFVSELRAKR